MIPIRLQQIQNMILPYKGVADIGTDHALLPCSLGLHPFWRGERIIGVDSQHFPLERGRETIERFGLQDVVQLRKGWGLKPLGEDEVDQVVISGMGGHNIVSILEDGLKNNKKAEHFFLQPHRDIFFLRKWLIKKGLNIIDEEISYEKGNFYFAIRADWGVEQRSYFDWELEIGPILLTKRPPLLEDYLKTKVQEFKNILEKIRGSKPGHSREEYFEEKICFLKGVRKWLYPQAG